VLPRRDTRQFSDHRLDRFADRDRPVEGPEGRREAAAAEEGHHLEEDPKERGERLSEGAERQQEEAFNQAFPGHAAAAKKAARTKGRAGRSAAAKKAARTRARRK
jgi:hypothetical protein